MVEMVQWCTYSMFYVLIPKGYDGKGGAVVLTRWIERMETVIDNSGCAENQKVRLGYWNDEAVSNGTLTKGSEKRKSVDEPAKCRKHRNEKVNFRVCFQFARDGHFARDCHSPTIPAAPVNAVDARPNQRACYECGDPNHLRNVYPKRRAYMNSIECGEDDGFNRCHGSWEIVSKKHNVRELKNAKVDEPKIVIFSWLRFVEVFPDDLKGLPPQRQVEFRIELIPGATPVMKSPYRLAPSEMQELSEQLEGSVRQGFLSLPDGVEDFVVYCDASNQGLGCVLMQRDKYEIRYHPGKANVVADALSRKERVKPRRVRAMAMTIQSGMKVLILAAQKEAFEQENLPSERLNGLEQQMEKRDDGSLYFLDLLIGPLLGWSSYHWLEFSYNTIQALRCAPFEALYGRKCRSPVLWAEIGESSLIGPELVQETTDKVGKLAPRSGPEFIWECEDYMKSKYPQLFVERTDESARFGGNDESKQMQKYNLEATVLKDSVLYQTKMGFTNGYERFQSLSVS
ncbi:hypothetical protein Tco_1377788 [Tanacetum coccineum]